jgi:protein-tyrosine-phosphatase
VPDICFLCTGNAARSVMAGTFFHALAPGWSLTTAGTHVIEGQPMSWRTRHALADLGYQAPNHRSHQFDAADADSALIVAFEPAHVAYVRRYHPEAAGRTGTLIRLVRELPAGDGLARRLPRLGLDRGQLEPWEEVPDPAGGDLPEVEACAKVVLDLTTQLAALLGQPG